MAMPQLKQKTFTLEEWATWEGLWELLDGVPFDMAPPSGWHQMLSSQLNVALANALEASARPGHGPCTVLAAPTGLYLGGETCLLPDLMVVCGPDQPTERGVDAPPDLVVEILSTSTAARDRQLKRRVYQAAGIPEYLLADPRTGSFLLLRLEDGQYAETARASWGGQLSLMGGTLPLCLPGDPRARRAHP